MFEFDIVHLRRQGVRMYSFLFFSIIFNSKTFHCYEFTNIVKELSLPAICPYTEFCTSKAVTNVSKESDRPCCASCLCTDKCHLNGNCCPDFQLSDVVINETLIEPICYFPVYNADAETLKDFNANIYTGINSYNSFVTCPKTYQNIFTTEKCEGIPKTVKELTVVSDFQDVVYKNIYCAECNGVNTTTSWNLKIKCKDAEYLLNFQLEDELQAFQDCMVWSLPPQPDIGKTSQCYKAYDSCNITGQLPSHPAIQQHHRILQSVCQSYTLYYFHIAQIGTRNVLSVFRNVHCFYCNFFQTILQEFCTLEGLEYLDLYKKNYAVAILNQTLYDMQRSEADQENIGKCDGDDVYDPLFDLCRQLTCPLTYTAFYGQCLSNYISTHGISMSIPLKIWPVDKDFFDNSSETLFDFINDSNDLNKLKEGISKAIVKPNSKCKHCNIRIISPINRYNQQFTVVVTYQTSEKCTLEKLYSFLHQYAKVSEALVAFSIDKKLFQFKTAIKHDYRTDGVESVENSISPEMKVCDQNYFYFGELICPKVTLNESEYEVLKTKTTVRGQRRTLRFCPREHDFKSVVKSKAGENKEIKKNDLCAYFDVCLHDFMTAINGGYCFMKSQSIETILIMFLFVFVETF